MTSVDYYLQTSHLKHYSFRSRDFPLPPKRVPTEASYRSPMNPPGMQLKPENQTDSKLCLLRGWERLKTDLQK